MTLTLAYDSKRPRRIPPVGYLSASSRRSDSDCLNRRHLEAVMQARRDRDNFAYRNGEPVPSVSPLRASDAALGLPAASIIERESAHPWRWVGLFAVACGALFAPVAVQIGVGAGLAFVAVVALRRACR